MYINFNQFLMNSFPYKPWVKLSDFRISGDMQFKILFYYIFFFFFTFQFYLFFSMSGGELFERITSDGYTMSEAEVINYMRQICEAVKHMHEKNIIHLDLKV